MDEFSRMKGGKIALMMVLSLALGVVLGLFIAWVIWPVELYEGPPHLLKQRWKDDYLYLISVGYALNGDREQAQARLKTLGVTDPGAAIIPLARKLKAAGASEEGLQALATLAQMLGISAPELMPYLPTPTPTLTPAPLPASISSPEPQTLSPQPTPTETPAPAFVLKAREMRCHNEEQEPVLEIEVLDWQGNPLPGIGVIVSWEGGEEKLFTGLKPGKSPGYTDFVMDRTSIYRVKLDLTAGEEAQGLMPLSGECPPERPLSSWHIVFQETQP